MKEPVKPVPPKIDEDEVCVCFNLRKAARVVTQIYDEVMRPLGYRATQVTLLGVITNYSPITVKQLAGVIDTDPTTLLRNLRILEKRHLLRLDPGEDRRERIVTLTEKGTELLRKAYPLWKETQQRIAEKVGKENLNQLLHGLNGALNSIHDLTKKK